MSEQNVELVRGMIGWVNREDVEAAQAHSTHDVEIVPLRAALEDTSYRGPQAFASFLADNQEAWEELQFDPEAIRDVGVRVVAIGNVSARARGTGAPVTARVAMLFEFRGDQFSRLQTYAEVDEALQAAGLSE